MNEVVVQPQDQKYLLNNPNFNPDRNKAIIAETIRETEETFNKIQEIKDRDGQNRMDIMSSYGIYRFTKGTKNIKDYLGRELYNQLIGEKTLAKVRMMDSVNRLNHNDKFKKSILL